jgi:hypothetical protein
MTSGPMPSPPMTASEIVLFIGSLSQTGRFDRLNRFAIRVAR